MIVKKPKRRKYKYDKNKRDIVVDTSFDIDDFLCVDDIDNDEAERLSSIVSFKQHFIEVDDRPFQLGAIKHFDYSDITGALVKPGRDAPVTGTFGQACRITFLPDPILSRDDFTPTAQYPVVDVHKWGGGPLDVLPDTSAAPPFPSDYQKGDNQLQQREVVIDKNGQPRQAGATTAEGEYIKRYKKRAEESLFIFLKGVLGRFFLTPHFHRDICRFIQKCPPARKLVLMPREHAKTTIVAGGLPPHILIQPAATNIYFPGIEGSECRILLSGETETMAKKNLRVVQSIFEENKIFRAFWPHRVYEGKARSEAKMWSDSGIIIPRENEWPDPTVRAVGVGGAITGSRPNVMIKDDLVSFKAANSETVMTEAIEWHKASRALLDKYEIESGLQSLEFIIGTRWAVYDLYSEIIDNDPSVEVNDESFHRIIRDGKILWPEKYTKADIEQLRTEHGSKFYLLYLNSAADPALTDFDMDLVRDFSIIDGCVVFEESVRDEILLKRNKSKSTKGKPPVTVKRGEVLSATIMNRLIEGGGGTRLRAA